jgi:hypothetical protein
MELWSIRKDCVAPTGLGLILRCVPRAYESVSQPAFPQLVFFGESRKSCSSNKSVGRKGMWISTFGGCNTDSYGAGEHAIERRGHAIGIGIWRRFHPAEVFARY